MEMSKDRVPVLDHGYVRLVDVLGSDLSVVNAARTSYDKESQELDDSDRKLLSYLARNEHTSPFRHATLTFEVYAPLMVARQWWKHVIGGDHTQQSYDPATAWNESSRRYVTEDVVLYVPDELSQAPDNSKQGAGDVHPDSNTLLERLKYHYDVSNSLYESLMANGVAPEQARLALPAYGMYVRWRWTTSLHAVLHFLDLRNDAHAQQEIRAYAQVIDGMVAERYPACHAAWTEKGD